MQQCELFLYLWSVWITVMPFLFASTDFSQEQKGSVSWEDYALWETIHLLDLKQWTMTFITAESMLFHHRSPIIWRIIIHWWVLSTKEVVLVRDFFSFTLDSVTSKYIPVSVMQTKSPKQARAQIKWKQCWPFVVQVVAMWQIVIRNKYLIQPKK